MNSRSNSCFRIPIRETTLESLGKAELKDIEFHELVGLTLVATMASNPASVTSANAEAHYARLLNTIIEWPKSDKEILFNTRIKGLSTEQCKDHLKQAGIDLMPLAEFDARHYRTPTGEWITQNQRVPKFDLKLNRFLKSEDETLRQANAVALRIKRCPDEHVMVGGVAGCGKTHLIRQVTQSLSREDLIVLTAKPGQFAGTDIRVSCFSPVEACRHFAQSLIGDNFDQRFGKRIPFDRMADYFAVNERHGWDRATVMSYIWETVDNFCRSRDLKFGDSHLPGALPEEWIAEAKYFVETAETVWRNLAKPRLDSKLPLTDLHIIKLAQLNDFYFSCASLLIDEHHDLPPSMTDIIEKNSDRHVVMAFGDNRQITDTHPRLGKISQYPVDCLSLDQSIRSGMAVAPLIEAAMSSGIDDGARSFRFYGNECQKTEIIPYEYSIGGEIFIPQQEALMISGSAWWLLVASIKLMQMKKSFDILPGTLGELYSVLDHSISFRNNFVNRRRHPLFMGCSSWQGLVESRNFGVAGLIEFNRLLDSIDLDLESWKKHVDGGKLLYRRSGKGYVLGMAEEAKGHEVNTSMIFPDLANLVGALNNKKLETETVLLNKLYVSLTRAKRRIYLPRLSRILELVQDR